MGNCHREEIKQYCSLLMECGRKEQATAMSVQTQLKLRGTNCLETLPCWGLILPPGMSPINILVVNSITSKESHFLETQRNKIMNTLFIPHPGLQDSFQSVSTRLGGKRD